LRSEVQPEQTNASTANVVDSSWPIQTQLSAVYNNNDIGLYANSVKAVQDDKKYILLAHMYASPPEYNFKKDANAVRALLDIFFEVLKG